MRIRSLSFLFYLLSACHSWGQLRIECRWGAQQIVLGASYNLGSETISFDELKMYLSDFRFEGALRKSVFVGPHLIDLSDPASLNIFSDFPIEDYSRMTFQFGLDSTYHVSETVSGDLDPLKGMYWAWNSGYIQFKCTGNSSVIPQSDKQFEFHLGGYRKPLDTMVPISLDITGKTLVLDLKPFFENSVNFDEIQRIMIPGKLSKSYCQSIASHFYLK